MNGRCSRAPVEDPANHANYMPFMLRVLIQRL